MEELRPCAKTTGSVRLEAMLRNKRSHQMTGQHTAKKTPAHHNQRKPTHSHKDPARPKLKKKKKNPDSEKALVPITLNTYMNKSFLQFGCMSQ